MNEEIRESSMNVRVSARKFKTEEFFKLTCENLKRLEGNKREGENGGRESCKENVKKSKHSRAGSRYSSTQSDKEKRKSV